MKHPYGKALSHLKVHETGASKRVQGVKALVTQTDSEKLDIKIQIHDASTPTWSWDVGREGRELLGHKPE